VTGDGAIAELGRRFALDAIATERLGRLAAILAADPAAPTTVRDPAAVRRDHLADSLVALELAEVRSATATADLGAGAGLPGLPLAIALPGASVHLVESNGRKCEFLRRVVADLELENVAVMNARAESWPAGIGANDLVTARAVAPLNVLAEYAAPLLKVGGHLVAWRGKREAEVEADAAQAAEILGLSGQDPVQVYPYAAAEHRYLHVMSKVMETPSRFPRREGVARKRPLGAGGTGI
jgi:16S rRNA (guanine527-N7)-methyltransferase